MVATYNFGSVYKIVHRYHVGIFTFLYSLFANYLLFPIYLLFCNLTKRSALAVNC